MNTNLVSWRTTLTPKPVVDPHKDYWLIVGFGLLNQTIWVEHLISSTSQSIATCNTISISPNSRVIMLQVPPCIHTSTGSFAFDFVPLCLAIRRLRQFSLMLVMGLWKGKGGPPTPWGQKAPNLVASIIVPGG